MRLYFPTWIEEFMMHRKDAKDAENFKQGKG